MEAELTGDVTKLRATVNELRQRYESLQIEQLNSSKLNEEIMMEKLHDRFTPLFSKLREAIKGAPTDITRSDS